MKPSQLLVFVTAAVMVDAFTTIAPSTPSSIARVANRHHRPVPVKSFSLFESSTAVAEKASTDTEQSPAQQKEDDGRSVYEKLGITKDQLAMGVNPEEVLEWIGTREEMVEKVLQDIPKFNRAQAEAEVDKYLMDPEVMNYHIEFKKRLAENPDMLNPVEEDEGFFSFRTLVIAYVSYVGGEIVYQNVLRDYVNLDFIPGWAPKIAASGGDDVAAAAADAAQSTLDAAASVVDAVSNGM